MDELRKIKTERDTRAKREREDVLIKRNRKKLYKYLIIVFSVI
jgi:hypothetical protein